LHHGTPAQKQRLKEELIAGRWSTEIMLAKRRLAVLETAVESLTAEKHRGEHTDEPRGKFAHIGGIERHPARSFETPEKPIDFSAIGGKVVRRASDLPMFNAKPAQKATGRNHHARQKGTAPS
jgi:hypothetical protein